MNDHRVDDIMAVSIRLASPEEIRGRSSGEVTRAELDEGEGGLFCERIFGPATLAPRWRMGHIEPAAPVVHPWFFQGIPSYLGTLLDIRASALCDLIYYRAELVLAPEDPDYLWKDEIMPVEQWREEP